MAKSAFSRSKREGDPEIKPAVAVNVITIKQDLLSQLEGRIPSWEKMKKVVAHFVITKDQTKECNNNKQHGVHCINRCRIATGGK